MKFYPSVLAVTLASLLSLPTLSMADDSSPKIDVNTTTVKQLTSIPGIGESKAAAIVMYRKDHGAFQSLEDLDDVSGIGPKKLAKISPYLTVGSADKS
jgi:competence protein ComEA